MKAPPTPKAPKNYPAKTEGTKIAQDARAECNKLSDAARANLLKEGMALIYGRKSKARKAARRRH